MILGAKLVNQHLFDCGSREIASENISLSLSSASKVSANLVSDHHFSHWFSEFFIKGYIQDLSDIIGTSQSIIAILKQLCLHQRLIDRKTRCNRISLLAFQHVNDAGLFPCLAVLLIWRLLVFLRILACLLLGHFYQ